MKIKKYLNMIANIRLSSEVKLCHIEFETSSEKATDFEKER
jgi:hypothetical protein